MAHPWVDNTRPVYPGTVREGYLVKSPPLDKKGVKLWKKRWCVFTCTGHEPACLLYFNDREAVTTGRMPIKRVCLDNCFKVERDLKHSHYRNVFALHLPDRVFYFSCNSHQEMLDWAEALTTNLKLKPQSNRVQGWVTMPRTDRNKTNKTTHPTPLPLSLPPPLPTSPPPHTPLSSSSPPPVPLSPRPGGKQSAAGRSLSPRQPPSPRQQPPLRTELPLPPLPSSPSPPAQLGSLPPPLPHRPEALRHTKSKS